MDTNQDKIVQVHIYYLLMLVNTFMVIAALQWKNEC